MRTWCRTHLDRSFYPLLHLDTKKRFCDSVRVWEILRITPAEFWRHVSKILWDKLTKLSKCTFFLLVVINCRSFTLVAASYCKKCTWNAGNPALKKQKTQHSILNMHLEGRNSSQLFNHNVQEPFLHFKCRNSWILSAGFLPHQCKWP